VILSGTALASRPFAQNSLAPICVRDKTNDFVHVRTKLCRYRSKKISREAIYGYDSASTT
jgi:hypothetical protein